MLRVVDIWESDLNRVATMPYTSAQNFYPPCILCGDTCSGWRVERVDDREQRFLDWVCKECAEILSKEVE